MKTSGVCIWCWEKSSDLDEWGVCPGCPRIQKERSEKVVSEDFFYRFTKRKGLSDKVAAAFYLWALDYAEIEEDLPVELMRFEDWCRIKRINVSNESISMLRVRWLDPFIPTHQMYVSFNFFKENIFSVLITIIRIMSGSRVVYQHRIVSGRGTDHCFRYLTTRGRGERY